MSKVETAAVRLLSSSLALAAGMAGSAFAQDNSERGVGEIVVTAQRFEQTIREVPVSIAALGNEELEDLGINDLKDITGQVPNLFINNFNGRSDTVRLFIRGIGQNDVSLTQDPSVALYIDNIYVGSAIGSSFDSLDLERVEILRGPQGTLYGRNSTGGAVNLIPRRPDLDEFNASAFVGAGNYDLRTARVGLNLPIFENRLGIKIDYGRTERDGWVENLGPGDDFSLQDRQNVRAALRWAPTDSVTVDYAYDWSQVQDTQPFTTATSLLPGTPGPDGGRVFDLVGAPPGFDVNVETRNTDPQVSQVRPDSATSLRPVLPGNSQISGHAINVDWDVTPNFTLRSITGYRRIASLFQGDYLPTFEGRLLFGSTPLDPNIYGSIGGQNTSTHFRNISQEFQALGTTNIGGGELRYVGGLYYYQQEAEQVQQSVFVFPRGGASATIDDSSWALFGEATFTPNAFDNRLHVTLGGRYSEDERSATRINESSIAYARLGGMTAENCANQAFLGQILPEDNCPTGGGVVQAATYDRSFENFSASGSIAWELTDAINIYGRVAQGYKTGGTSERSADPNLFSVGYEPEEILSYEVGVKGLYFDSRLAVNAAVFYMTLDHFQTSVQTGTTPGDRDFVGLDDNSYQGLEADATWRVNEHLTLTSGLGLLETEVGPDTVTFPLSGVGTRTDQLIAEFPYAPEQTFNVGINYETALADYLNMSATLNYAYQSTSQTSLNVFENTSLDARGVLDGSVTLRLTGLGAGETSVRIWGRNILDEDYRIVDNRSFAFVGAAQQAEWGEPATFGVTLGYEY
jgi:iron complex outermembrane receptor protein